MTSLEPLPSRATLSNGSSYKPHDPRLSTITMVEQTIKDSGELPKQNETLEKSFQKGHVPNVQGDSGISGSIKQDHLRQE